MVDVSYIKTSRGLRPKPYRPKTLGEARRLIDSILERNTWDERCRTRYLRSHDIEPKSISELTLDEARRILDDLERSRMVIFMTE